MSSKGDWVERVADTGSATVRIARSAMRVVSGELPQIGKIYQVRAVSGVRGPDGPWDGLKLVGIVIAIPGSDDAWIQASAFRPIYRPKSSIIEQLKQPILEPVRELLPID